MLNFFLLQQSLVSANFILKACVASTQNCPSPKPNSIQNSTSIEFYNNTGSEINACYAYYNNNDRCWTSVGWYIVPAYSYKTINIGNYSGNVYIRGRQGLATEWGSGLYVCP